MNYEEKIVEYRGFLKDRIESAKTKHEYYINQPNKLSMGQGYGIERNTFAFALSRFQEIFGASERSGVGENERLKEDWDCQQEDSGYGRCPVICKDCAGYPQNQSD